MTMIQIKADVGILLDGWNDQLMTRRYKYPGLIPQLRAEMVVGTPQREEGNRSGKPVDSPMPVSESIASLLFEVEAWVGELVRWTGATRESQSVEKNLQWLMRVAEDYQDDDRNALATHLGLIRTRIEAALGWTAPPSRLRASCPSCEVADALLVYDPLGTARAICTSCHSAWDGESGLHELASEIKNKEN